MGRDFLMKHQKLNTNLLIVCLIVVAIWTISVLPLQNKTKVLENATVIKTVSQAPTAQAATSKPVIKKISFGAVHVPVLMYHHVGELENSDALAKDLTVSPQDFETQVQYFKNAGYNSVSLQQVYDAFENRTVLPAQPIVFTFDDGYADVFAYAVPVLEKYGYTGSFAIATELLGRSTYANWDDVVTAHDLGMEIVSHTENHLDLTSKVYSEADLHREIFDSKSILEDKLGVTVDFFIYPYGKYNDQVMGMVKAAGYKMAFTTAYGQDLSKDNLLALPRVRVHGQDGLEKLKKVFEEKHSASAQTNP